MAYRTNLERETIILMNAAEQRVEVWTADPVYMRKCDKLVAADPENWKLVKEEADSKTYETTKPFVKLRKKRPVSGTPFKAVERA
jgi:hypothetical protein